MVFLGEGVGELELVGQELEGFFVVVIALASEDRVEGVVEDT